MYVPPDLFLSPPFYDFLHKFMWQSTKRQSTNNYHSTMNSSKRSYVTNYTSLGVPKQKCVAARIMDLNPQGNTCRLKNTQLIHQIVTRAFQQDESQYLVKVLPTDKESADSIIYNMDQMWEYFLPLLWIWDMLVRRGVH